MAPVVFKEMRTLFIKDVELCFEVMKTDDDWLDENDINYK